MSSNNRPRSFLIAFLGICLGAVVAHSIVVLLIDPFWRFDLVTIDSLNGQRPVFTSDPRMAKAGVVCRLQPASVVLGSSRVEVGIDPKHPGWGRTPGAVYNMGMAGAGIWELERTMRHTVNASSDLRQVLVGLDFLMFNADREAIVFGSEVFGFDEKRLLLDEEDTCWESFIYDIDTFLGPHASVNAIRTVKRQMDKDEDYTSENVGKWLALYDNLGFRNHFDILRDVLAPVSGFRGLFGTGQETGYLQKVWFPLPERRFCFVRGGQANTFDAFREMILLARESNIELKFFINPIHARMLIALREAGLWPQYEAWKKTMVEILEVEATEAGEEPYLLWDFSGFNSVTTEVVPPAGDTTTMMKWFWEPSHYQSEAGNMILDRVLDYQDDNRKVPESFGIKLTKSNIDERILVSRGQALGYMQREKEDTLLVKEIVEKVREDTEGANCGYDVQVLREGAAALQRGDQAAADEAFERAIAIHKSEQMRFAEIGVPFREDGFETLLADAKAGRTRLPKLSSWQAYQTRGKKFFDSGDLQAALDDFNRAVFHGPPNAPLYLLRGDAFLKSGDAAKAIEDYEAALRLDTANSFIRTQLDKARAAGSQN